MSDLRQDPLLKHWVIVAANRSQRPGAFIDSPPFDPGLPCPFCEGREGETPREVLAFRDPTSQPDRPLWRVRVVPNKFPAIGDCGDARSVDEGMYRRLEACGAHEVIIESPRHVASTSALSTAELSEVFLAYQMRLAYWKRDPRMAYGQIFKNVGQAAGASLEHAHSQLLVIPRVPNVIAAEMAASLDYFRQRGCCPLCDMIREERAVGQRVVLETNHHFSFVPFAARLPFETWILPKVHSSHYEGATREQLEDLAGVLRSAIRRLETAAGGCAYNYFFHTAPFDAEALAHYHWHLEIVPAMVRPAGFELGSGWFINPIAPEVSARLMRDHQAC